jgi:dihydrofolate reductase
MEEFKVGPRNYCGRNRENETMLGKDIVLLGGADIASTFMKLGLIDECRILVNPVVLGSGKPLFLDIKDRIHLKLLKTKMFNSGVVILYYQPDRKEPK